MVLAVLIFAILRLIHAIPKFRHQHTWRSDLRPIYWIAGIALVVVFVPSLLIGLLFSNMCGTSRITEVPSPDGRHKLVVYNFDCGATTDFSLDVSLLRADQELPKYKPSTLLYHRYHQCPTPAGPERNFEVKWEDSRHVTVLVGGLDTAAKTKHQDGVEISFGNLP